MKKRTAVLAAVSAGTLAATSLFGGPAMANDDSLTPEQELSKVQEMAAKFIEKEYGLSSDDARDRAKKQDEHGQKAESLQSELGDKVTSSYIDQRAGKLVVSVTSEEAAKKVKEKGAEAKIVKQTRSALEEVRTKAADKVGQKALASHLDETRNVIVMTVPEAEVEATKKATAGMPDIEVKGTDAETVTQAKLYGGQQIEFSGHVCSAGFAATKDGRDVFITAGHCAEGNQTFKRKGTTLGKTAAYSFPNDDMAYATLASGWEGVGAVDRHNGRGVRVDGAKEAPVGTAVCKSGRTTQWTCGTIKAKNVTVNYRGKNKIDVVKGLTMTDTCTEGGDSGGSWLAGTQAQGVTSGGAGYGAQKVCGEKVGKPNVAYYAPLKPILDRYKLTLKTYQGR